MAKKILIGEDEISLSTALKDKFFREGYEVEVANNGAEALEKALASHPDVILMDIMMPEKDGLQAVEALRQDEWGKTAKIILLTNFSQSDKIARAIQLGISEYLVKSNWDLDEVVEKTKKVLG